MNTYDYEPKKNRIAGVDEIEEDVIEEEVVPEPEPEPEPEVEPTPEPEPPPAPAVATKTVEEMKYEAFCDGIDAACRMYGGLCNIGHKRQMAAKGGYTVPPE